MRNWNKIGLLLVVCTLVVLSVAGCYSTTDGVISVRRDTVNAGSAEVGDSVCATFKFRNNTYATQTVTFLPECDCTTVSAESLRIEPHRRGSIEVKVAVETKGEFTKYVYVQAAGGDEFFTVSIKGRGK
ncbi:MAG: DUF1573 domain-containing protein [Bacteroidaceae bacterium]|nr:DUF1573 domain-containing protein [Bacteroidaceae bacterium]